MAAAYRHWACIVRLYFGILRLYFSDSICTIQFDQRFDLSSFSRTTIYWMQYYIHWKNQKHFRQRWKNCVSLIFVQFSFSLLFGMMVLKIFEIFTYKETKFGFIFNFTFSIFIQFKRTRLRIVTVFGFILRNCPRKYLWHLILQSEFQFWQYHAQWKNISENIWDKKWQVNWN